MSDLRERLVQVLRDAGVGEVETSRYSSVGCTAEAAADAVMQELSSRTEQISHE